MRTGESPRSAGVRSRAAIPGIRQQKRQRTRLHRKARSGACGTRRPVTVVLPPTSDCDADGAVYTGDGRRLSSRLELTVFGPEGWTTVLDSVRGRLTNRAYHS